jgi:protein disulfide-isomerase A6
MALKLLIAATLVAGANAGAIALDPSNFDAEVFDSGKSAFIKFLAPW